MSISWIYLIIAGCLECCWAVGIKYTEGFTRPMPSMLTAAAMAASFWLLSLAMKTIPVGTAYAVWTGIGATGVAIFGIILFDEPRDLARILCLLLILAGVIGLKLFSGGSQP
jgi:quaternary ammonium compound-resistance protein SugE